MNVPLSYRLVVVTPSNATAVQHGLYLENPAAWGNGGGVDIHGSMGNWDAGTIRFMKDNVNARVGISAALDGDGTGLSVVSGGNVGVGTTLPATSLDVNGPAQFGSGAAKSTFSATGALTMASGAAITGNVTGSASLNVLKAGDTMTGALTLPADPTVALQAATKQYVDSWSRPCVNPGDASDTMVPVGDLCVDKYEASVWSTPTGGTQYGAAAQDYPCGNGATGNGQTCGPGTGTTIYARSVSGVTPSRWITWFQANIACANAGKHLLTNAEWQAAAAGTPDPGAGVVTPPGCNVNTAGPNATGADTSCLSSYGVMDMVGNLWEWTADWGQYGQISQATYVAWADGTLTNTQWPDAGYGADGSWNVAGRTFNGVSWVNGLPGAVLRGGDWGDGARAGVFAFTADSGPSCWGSTVGFRCGRRR